MTTKTDKKKLCNCKLCIYLILTAILLMTICIGSYYYLKYTANQVTIFISDLENSVIANDWNNAYINYDQALDHWDKHKNIWQCFLQHQEIDDIESMFQQLKGYLKTKNVTDSLSSLYELKYNINHVPDTERISLYNIL